MSNNTLASSFELRIDHHQYSELDLTAVPSSELYKALGAPPALRRDSYAVRVIRERGIYRLTLTRYVWHRPDNSVANLRLGSRLPQPGAYLAIEDWSEELELTTRLTPPNLAPVVARLFARALKEGGGGRLPVL